MCGIFGIVARNGRIPDGLLERGTQSLAHRGPDDSGTVVIRDASAGEIEIGLGNRRLAILDLSPLAHQPMRDAESGNSIVYNGEIYNFREIRAELELAGDKFVSHSDTEVILRAYSRWGESCLTKLRGMFAFAIWDARRHRLFLARDPMGIKPLYYVHTGEYFLFASEVRSLLGTGLVSRAINPAGLANYLTFGCAYDPLTLIAGVQALPAGSMLVWERGHLRVSQYWDLVEEGAKKSTIAARANTGNGKETIAEKLRPSLEEAVRLQLVSDVPVGVFLSGGIDSSALVSILSAGGLNPKTFSIVFREEEFSEAAYSRVIAKKFRTHHHEISLSQADVLAAVPDALCAMDLPTMDGINTFFVSREARRAGIKVALSGLGGDEVFAGYSSFHTVPRMERFAKYWSHLPYGLRRAAGSTFSTLSRENDQNRKLFSLMGSNGRIPHPYFLTRMLFTPGQRDLLFRPLGEDWADLATASQRAALQQTAALDPINRVSYLESRCYMLNTLLRDSDFMSMSQGLEVRVPLLDHLLAKMVFDLPGPSKLTPTPKGLLVDALAESLPDEIVHRPKRGFTLPFERWMRQELRPVIELVLSSKRIADGPLGGLLDGVQVNRIWRDFLRGTTSWSRPWSLYVLQRWCEINLQLTK